MRLPADRRVIVALSVAGFALGALHARRGGVGPIETRWFTRVNHLPSAAFPAVWSVMQLGSLAGSVGLGVGVAATGRRRLGTVLAAAAAATWAVAKAVKPGIDRGRPVTLLEEARVLGGEQAGLGYPSGHAAVAMTLAAVAAPHVAAARRPALWVIAAVVGTARVYTGAHLPLDVAGGAALGLALGTVAAPYGSSDTPRSASSSWPS